MQTSPLSLYSKYKALTEEQRKTILDQFQALNVEGHVYSAFNLCLLSLQQAPQGMFGGFNQWRKSKKIVKKGEHGFKILYPSKRKAKENEKNEENQKPSFFTATVFHEKQVSNL